jgi:hypothetical protein
MRRILILSIVLMLAALACSIPTPVTPAGVTAAAPTAQPPVPTDTQGAPAPTETQGPPPANASCGPLSVYLPPAVASSYDCQTVPEAADLSLPPFGINPQYNEITLAGYPFTANRMTPHIDVFPVQRYRELLPDLVNPRVAALQALIAGGAPPPGALPLLPIFNAAQMFRSHYLLVPFQSGNGYHIVTMYGQAYYPASNYDVFFSYQGLTADGGYWVSIILPISHPSLPAEGGNPPAGFENNAEAYFQQIAAQLDAEAPTSFTPSILDLETMIGSITVQP